MKKYIVGNWKMNNDFSDLPLFVKSVKKLAKNEENLVVCVPSVMIQSFAKLAKNKIATGAQNCHFEKNGAFTGEISASMAKNAGASYIIIGHSERRSIFGESNELINKKVKAVLAENLKVIFCIGETLEEKSKYKSVLKKQILEGLDGIQDFSNVIVAYEPVWAIGTGKVATIQDIVKVHGYIKEVIKESFGFEAKILYGGSVKPSNSKEILEIADVDGVLVGGASLKASDFLAITNSR